MASVFDAILPAAQVVCVHVVIYPLLEKKSKAHVYIHLFFRCFLLLFIHSCLTFLTYASVIAAT